MSFNTPVAPRNQQQPPGGAPLAPAQPSAASLHSRSVSVGAGYGGSFVGPAVTARPSTSVAFAAPAPLQGAAARPLMVPAAGGAPASAAAVAAATVPQQPATLPAGNANYQSSSRVQPRMLSSGVPSGVPAVAAPRQAIVVSAVQPAMLAAGATAEAEAAILSRRLVEGFRNPATMISAGAPASAATAFAAQPPMLAAGNANYLSSSYGSSVRSKIGSANSSVTIRPRVSEQVQINAVNSVRPRFVSEDDGDCCCSCPRLVAIALVIVNVFALIFEPIIGVGLLPLTLTALYCSRNRRTEINELDDWNQIL